MKIFDELKRRNVIKATIAYIVVAWVLLQIIAIVLPNFGAPPWLLKTLIFLIAIGLPIWIIFSWVYEITPEGLKKTNNVSKDKSITRTTNKRLNIIIIITLIITIVLTFVQQSTPKTTSKAVINNDLVFDKSIAVIPFKNLSDNKENEYFADGMMDDILNQLSIIQGLEVKSRQSSECYHGSIKSIRQIGKELGVNYLIEGSVQKHKDSIRIIVQLIDALNDTNLWSDKYDFEFKNVFTIQSEISKQIAFNLNMVLPPTGIEQIEKTPTNNVEAYNLYLNGRFFWHLRNKEDLNKSIYYFNKAIELDSEYALAYAGLADAYYIMGWWGWLPKNEGFSKGKEYAQKALAIDNTIAQAHATLGSILTFDEWKWKEAEKELQIAISLNPNCVTAHHYYYELLDVLGRNEEAREHVDWALKLNPFSMIFHRQSAYMFYNNLDFEKAIQGFQKAINLEIGNDMLIYPDQLTLIRCYLKLGQHELVKESINDFISTDTLINYNMLDELYNKNEIDGLLNWFVNWLSMNQSEKYIEKTMLASFYVIIGDSESALNYLEKSYIADEPGLPFINSNLDFKSIKTEPRFIDLLKKMDLYQYQLSN